MADWGATMRGLDALDGAIEGMQDTLTSATYVTGTNTSYAVHVEYGTSRMQANRGLRDAIDITMREVNAGKPNAETTDELCRWIAFRIEELWKAGIEGELSGPERVDFGNLLRSVRAEKVS